MKDHDGSRFLLIIAPVNIIAAGPFKNETVSLFAMKRITAVLCVFALIAAPCVSGGVSAANSDFIWLYEIMPSGSFEAVTVYNAGNTKANLKDYYLDDGEGTVRFTSDLFIEPKCYVTIASSTPETWFTGRTVYLYGTYGITARSFVMADNGDEVMLKRSSDNKVLDTLVYGNGDTGTQGWTGAAFGKVTAGKMAVRCSAFDTDTLNDWKISVAGRTDETMNSSETFDSAVIPFVFPDSKGDPVFSVLEKASKEVLISVYLLDHRDIVSLLMLLLGMNVKVSILLEGSPGGGVPDTEIRYMSVLCGNGADIHIMKSNGVYKRYDLVHSKYAVVDSRTVIITSENWREQSFGGNRGWGIIVENEGYAEYMRNIFLSDHDISRYDVFSLKEIYPDAAPVSVPQYKMIQRPYYESFHASVKPVLSPDFSFEYLRYRMLGATERIYTEQMSIQYAWTDTSVQSPLSWSLTAAKNGADVRILADVTFDTAGEGNYAVVSVINGTDGIQARTVSGGDGFGLMHNKGVIIDDTVWVSSINWSNAAFTSNREAAAEIHSKEVADYYAAFFLSDWGDHDMTLTVDIRGNTAGTAVILDASSSSFPWGTVFEWDLDGDGIADRTGVKIAVLLPEGINKCVLTATDASGNEYRYVFSVMIYPPDDMFSGSYIKYAPILAIMLAILAFAVIRRRK